MPERWSAVILALAALAMPWQAALAQPPSRAEVSEFGPPGTPFVLRALGRCLEVNEPQLQVDGARVQLQRCDGRPNQAWRRERGQIVNVASGRCLDVHGPDAGFNGARVQAVNCSAAPNQQWRYERGQLVVRVDGRCLDAQAFDTARPLAQVQTWDCQGGPVQRWRVLPLVATPPSLPWGPPVGVPPAPAAPSTRDVEAGPLFSNADAARKCPAVCAPGRWSGQWATTVPGRMSVCGCVFEPPPSTAPPPPPPMQAMAGERFDTLVRLLDDEAFPAGALRLLETVARDHRFQVDQVRKVLEVFHFGSDRLRALETLLPRLVDRTNAFELLGAFDFESERAEARRLMERAAGGR